MDSRIRTVVPVYASLVMIWALTPLAIVWSVAEIPKFWSLVLRFCLAAPIIAVVLATLRVKLPLTPTALHSYLAGSFSLIVSQTFTYQATSYLSSGMIALMFGFAPVVAGLIAYILYRQRLSGIQWLGMAIAILGLYMNTMADGQARPDLIGLVLMFCAILTYAASIFWVKHINARIAPIAQASGSIFVSATIALCFLPFIWADIPHAMPGPRSMLAIGYLVLASSVVGMFCYFKLMQNVSATTLSLATVLTPMLAIGFGILLNDEPFRINIIIGTVLVITGLLFYFYRDLQKLFVS
ncbi:EamA family transporter [Eoetvoesia caeni]|nr:EamA family transporter [Eoetvoesiella caeni]